MVDGLLGDGDDDRPRLVVIQAGIGHEVLQGLGVDRQAVLLVPLPLGGGVLLGLGSVLGLFWRKPAGESWPPEVLALAGQREQARQDRDWAQADALRKRLLDEFGVVLEDVKGQPPRLKRR